MKGKDINAEIDVKTHEQRAKEVIRKIKSIIVERKEEVEEAEKKLEEVLNKEIEEITEKDGRSYDWE